jgi:Spy/CpxP family protein refolding chaperone
MKKKFWLVGLFAAVLAGSALTVQAQDHPAPAGDNGSQAVAAGAQPGGWPQGGIDLEKMKGKLALTEDQVSKLKDVLKLQMECERSIRDQMRIDMDILQKKVDSNASGADLKKILDILAADRKAMEANRQKMEDMAREILTPLQQVKMISGMRGPGSSRMNQGAPSGK